MYIWTASSEFGTYRLCEQRRFRRACASAQSRQNLRCSLIQAVNQEEPSDRKPDPWPSWMAGHAQLKFVMTECSKTQIRLTGPIWSHWENMKTNRCIIFLFVMPNIVKTLQHSYLKGGISVWSKKVLCMYLQNQVETGNLFPWLSACSCSAVRTYSFHQTGFMASIGCKVFSLWVIASLYACQVHNTG